MGRSRCPYCDITLRWYELIPLLSFVIQLGRCRHCHALLSWQYPIVELVSGLMFVGILMSGQIGLIWLLAAMALLLLSLIDLRLYIIPDQINLFLALLGVGILVDKGISSSAIWQGHLLGFFVGAAFFGLIILITKGKGMGMGDLKLVAALGFLFGWPKILLIIIAAFVLGSISSVFLLLSKRKTMKDGIPFGPFLAVAAMVVLLFGNYIIGTYGIYF